MHSIAHRVYPFYTKPNHTYIYATVKSHLMENALETMRKNNKISQKEELNNRILYGNSSE